MSYNPGGWSDDKVKVMGLLVLAAIIVVIVLGALGIIDLGPPPQVPK